MKKIFIAIATVIMVLAILSPATALAASPIVNGSFETRDYTGWTLWEGNLPDWPQNGTWGIARDGEVIESGNETYDFHDGIMVTQRYSPGFRITYETTDGEYLAYQLQTAPQDHRMYQDVVLLGSATILSWDMFYTNYAVGGFSDSQYLAVHIRDLADTVLETLFITVGDPQSIPMTHFTYDISAYAESTIRIDVEMRVQQGVLDAGFDNFVIDQIDNTEPPGWDKGKKAGWNGSVPPGLEKKDKTPPGFDKGKKTGWK